MNAYNCTKCGAGLYSAAEVKEPLCAECERDEQINKMRLPEEIMAEIIAQRVAMVAEDDAEYHLGWVEALEWVMDKELCPGGKPLWRDYVEVVRCKGCRYRDTEDCPSAERQCFRNNIGVIKERWVTGDYMDYCSYGEGRSE